MIPTPPTWRGFSFALHLLRVQGFYFTMLQYATYKRLQRVLRSQCSYTAHAAKQRTWLCSGVSGYFLCFADVVCGCICLLHHLRHAGRCTGQHSRPIIIMYIKRCSIQQTMPARRGLLPLCADRWQVLTRCQQYRPGAPAEGSASPPVQG